MSQRIIKHGELEATAGYDRMTGVLFLSIRNEAIEEDEPGHEVFDCWLQGITWPRIVDELTKAGIPVPESLESRLKQDVTDNVGNDRSILAVTA